MAKTEFNSKNVVVATIREGSKLDNPNEKYKYVYVECDVTLKKGEKMYLAKPEENLLSLLDKGFIDEVEYENRLSKVADYKKYEITAKNEK